MARTYRKMTFLPSSRTRAPAQDDDMTSTDTAGHPGSTSTPTMFALHQTALGGPEVLRLTELARPAPGPGEILVAVHAAGLNPTDFKHRPPPISLPPPPMTLGWAVSGPVVRPASASPCSGL